MTGSNHPPGADNDPRAPYNQEPPMIETKVVEVTLGVEIEVPEYADRDREVREIQRAIEAGEYHLLDHETAELIDRRRG